MVQFSIIVREVRIFINAGFRAYEMIAQLSAYSLWPYERTLCAVFFADAPVCKSGQQKVHGVARQEAAKILCELDANPQEGIHFTWKFNNTAEIIDIPASHFTMDRARSTASYTPMTELDYGTLLCWGRNDLGVQKAPCVFQVIPAGTFSLSTTFCILVASLWHTPTLSHGDLCTIFFQCFHSDYSS